MSRVIKPSPHIIERPQKGRKKKERKERKVTIFSPEQMYARPPKITQILQKTQHMSKEDKASVITELFAQSPDLNFEKDIVPRLEAMKQAKQRKELKVAKDAEADHEKFNDPRYVLLDNVFRTINVHEKGKLSAYYQMKTEDVLSLRNGLKTYECHAKALNTVKGQALQFLQNIILERQTQAQAEPKKSFLRKLRGH